MNVILKLIKLNTINFKFLVLKKWNFSEEFEFQVFKSKLIRSFVKIVY